MVTGTAPRVVVAAVAAAGITAPTLGIPLPGSCLRTGATAVAAPSPSCGGDLRECLRLSADMHVGTFGVRYVTAEDVARCMEAFNSCVHGSARQGRDSVPTGRPPNDGVNSRVIPQRFGIRDSDGVDRDCRRDGDSVTCTETMPSLRDGVDSWTGTIAGTLSGMAVQGTWTSRQTGHSGDCLWQVDNSGPAAFSLRPDGTVSIRLGPFTSKMTSGGSCTATSSSTETARDVTGTWSAIQ